MQARRTWLFATRGMVAAAGLMFLLALQPEPAGISSDRSDSHARALILSDQARRYLTLQYRSYPTEFMGCMIGEIHGNAVIVRRIAPADVEPGHSTATRVVPEQTCEDAGWAGTVGMIHSHPDGQRCWYFFPGTRVSRGPGWRAPTRTRSRARRIRWTRSCAGTASCGSAGTWCSSRLGCPTRTTVPRRRHASSAAIGCTRALRHRRVRTKNHRARFRVD